MYIKGVRLQGHIEMRDDGSGVTGVSGKVMIARDVSTFWAFLGAGKITVLYTHISSQHLVKSVFFEILYTKAGVKSISNTCSPHYASHTVHV